MDVLWEMLDRGWPVFGPEELLFGRLGEVNGERLLSLGVLKARPLVPGRCHGPRCGRREILMHEKRWYAVCACDGDCGTTELLRHRLCELDLGRLRRRIRALLELRGRPVPPGGPGELAVLGARRFGRQRLTFAFAPRAHALNLWQVNAWVRGQSDVVIVVPEAPPPRSPLSAVPATWLPLRGVVDLSVGVSAEKLFDWLGVPSEPRPEPSAEPLVVVHESTSTARIGRHVVPLSRCTTVLALLTLLSKGGWFDEYACIAAVYPDHITPSGRFRGLSQERLRQRLRQTVASARRRLSETRVGIENGECPSGDRGYRLFEASENLTGDADRSSTP